jgi:hypothetical protein
MKQMKTARNNDAIQLVVRLDRVRRPGVVNARGSLHVPQVVQHLQKFGRIQADPLGVMASVITFRRRGTATARACLAK